MAFQADPIITQYLTAISASTDATKENYVNALAFAARHKIRPWIEEFPMTSEGLENALDALKSGSLRYRAVLSTEIEGAHLK